MAPEYPPPFTGTKIDLEDRWDEPPIHVRTALMLRVCRSLTQDPTPADLRLFDALDLCVERAQAPPDDDYKRLAELYETARREDPEIRYQRVAWILRYMKHAKAEDLARMTAGERVLVERCELLQEEGKNPEPRDFWWLEAVHRRVVPEGKWTRDDNKAYFAKLHAEIGCPGCMGLKMPDGKACGGPLGKDVSLGCGWKAVKGEGGE